MSINYKNLITNKIKEKFPQFNESIGGILSIWNNAIGESLNSLQTQLNVMKQSMFSYTDLSGDELDKRASEFYLYRSQPSKSTGYILVYKDGELSETIQSKLSLNGGYTSKENSIFLTLNRLNYILTVEEYNKVSIKPVNFINQLPEGFKCKIEINGILQDINITKSSPYKAYIDASILDLQVSEKIEVIIQFYGNFILFESDNVGFSQNLKPNSVMSIKGENIYNLNFISSNISFSGGSDLENDERLRERIRMNTNGVIAYFSVDSIKLDVYSNFNTIKKVGVKQPFLEEDKGKLWVYVTDYTNEYGIVNDEVLSNIKDYLITIKPASIRSDDISVSNPFVIQTEINISLIEPYSVILMEITKQSILDYFKNLDINVKQDKNININLLINYLINTVKDSSGIKLENIDLSVTYLNLSDNINNDGCVYEVVFV